jgi:hypothetical protein
MVDSMPGVNKTNGQSVTILWAMSFIDFKAQKVLARSCFIHGPHHAVLMQPMTDIFANLPFRQRGWPTSISFKKGSNLGIAVQGIVSILKSFATEYGGTVIVVQVNHYIDEPDVISQMGMHPDESVSNNDNPN